MESLLVLLNDPVMTLGLGFGVFGFILALCLLIPEIIEDSRARRLERDQAWDDALTTIATPDPDDWFAEAA